MADLLRQMKNGLAGQCNYYPVIKDGVFVPQPLPDAKLVMFNSEILSLPQSPRTIVADQYVDLTLVIDRQVSITMNHVDRKHSGIGEMVVEAESRGMMVGELMKCLFRLGHSDKLTDEELDGASYTNIDASTPVTRYALSNKEIFLLEDIGYFRNETMILIFLKDGVEMINVTGDKLLAEKILFSLRVN